MPRVSFVIPTQGKRVSLERSILSILRQNIQDLEIIIVYDKGDEQSDNFIFQISEKFPRLTVYQFDEKSENGHIGKLLNFGISRAKSEIIARLDDDDFCNHDRVRLQIESIESGFSLVGMQAINISETFKYLSVTSLPLQEEQIRRYAETRNPFVHSSVMFTRDSLEELGGYDEQLPLAQDYDLWLRFIKSEKRIINLSKIGILHTRSDNQLTHRWTLEQRMKNMDEIGYRNLGSVYKKSNYNLESQKKISFKVLSSLKWVFWYPKKHFSWLYLISVMRIAIINPIYAPYLIWREKKR